MAGASDARRSGRARNDGGPGAGPKRERVDDAQATRGATPGATRRPGRTQGGGSSRSGSGAGSRARRDTHGEVSIERQADTPHESAVEQAPPAPLERAAKSLDAGPDPGQSRLKLTAIIGAMLGLMLAAAVGQALIFYIGAFGSTSAPTAPEASEAVAGAAATPALRSVATAAAPSASAEPASHSAPAPVTRAPGGDQPLPVAESAVLPWTDQFGVLHVQVIVAVRNTTSAPMTIVPESISYSLQSEAGAPAMRGRFSVAIPAAVDPGGTAYLVDTTEAPIASSADLSKVSARIMGRSTATADQVLRVDRVAVTEGSDGPQATGAVTNAAPSAANNVAVLVLLRRASDHRLLGAVYDVADLTSLAPGAHATFTSAYPGAPPLPPDAVVTTDAVAAAEGG